MICFAVVCLVAAGLFLLCQALFRFSPQNVNDVIAFVRCVDSGELEDLGSEIIEENLRFSMSRDRFKAEQRKRALLLFEYLRRMSFNCRVMLGWGQQEQFRIKYLNRPNEKPIELIREFVTAGIAFRLSSLLALGRLFIWILLMRLKIAPPPRTARQLWVGNFNLVLKYRELTNVALKVAAYDSLDRMTRLAVGLFGMQSGR